MPFEEHYFYKILVILITLALAYLSYKFIVRILSISKNDRCDRIYKRTCIIPFRDDL